MRVHCPIHHRDEDYEEQKTETQKREPKTISFAISRPYDFRVLKDGTLIVNRWKFNRVGHENTKTWRFKLK